MCLKLACELPIRGRGWHAYLTYHKYLEPNKRRVCFNESISLVTQQIHYSYASKFLTDFKNKGRQVVAYYTFKVELMDNLTKQISKDLEWKELSRDLLCTHTARITITDANEKGYDSINTSVIRHKTGINSSPSVLNQQIL